MSVQISLNQPQICKKKFHTNPLPLISPLVTASPSRSSLSPCPETSKNSKKLPPINRPIKSVPRTRPIRIDPAFFSSKPCGVVQCYAVNTYQNKHHSEDRVRIIQNIKSPDWVSSENWPKSSFFAVFDGHNGKDCAEYLKKTLAEKIFSDHSFPFQVKEALKNGFEQVDEDFLKLAQEKINFSGSCALVSVIIGNKFFLANCGDSRAVISVNGGKMIVPLSKDHNFENSEERTRVLKAGGKFFSSYKQVDYKNSDVFLVIPGKVKVSRAFGDIDAKIQRLGGNPEVLVVQPEIKSFSVKNEQDFVLMATGSIWKMLSSKEMVQIVCKNLENAQEDEIGKCLGYGIEEIFREAISRGCVGNMTVVVIALKGVKKLLKCLEGGNFNMG